MFSDPILSLRSDQADTLVSALVERIRQLECDTQYKERTMDTLNDTIYRLRTENRDLRAALAAKGVPIEIEADSHKIARAVLDHAEQDVTGDE